MKHAGGVKRAIQQIELLVNLNRYLPFHSILSFYQRYMIDLYTKQVLLNSSFVEQVIRLIYYNKVFLIYTSTKNIFILGNDV